MCYNINVPICCLSFSPEQLVFSYKQLFLRDMDMERGFSAN